MHLLNLRDNKSVILLLYRKLNIMKSVVVFLLTTAFFLAGIKSFANDTTRIKHAPKDDVTIEVPNGFSITPIAENLGTSRHIFVNSNGDIYVKLGDIKNGKG